MDTIVAEAENTEVRNDAGSPPESGKSAVGGISGSTLKLIAVVTMLIDHIGAAVVMRVLSSRGFMDIAYSQDAGVVRDWMLQGNNYETYIVYEIMRGIGRIAFPIYCFLLVEGLQRTRNMWKYAMRLGLFALLSEIPFDLAFHGTVLEFTYQNVFFTLTAGMLSMIALEKVRERTWNENNAKLDIAIKILLSVLAVAAGMGAAALLRTDYDWRGVACILVMYFLRHNKWLELGAGYAAFVGLLGEIAALPAFIALLFYKGKKGFGMKYFFYSFYPVHLLILYLVCVLMRIASYPAL